MRELTIQREFKVVIFEGEPRRVDLSDLPSEVDIVHWDFDSQTGIVQYVRGTMETVTERDLDAERKEEKRRKDNNLKPLEEALYRQVQIHRRNLVISELGEFQKYYDRWLSTEN